ncbi:hypothetical protein HPB47_024352 [Ixodes persulcatus]|uniref:Uncharacterized protein n=1 Tax=Ixodes persulcatus TaxID=34615 RepID=A0AC60Q6N7_IXOPE|nr:hypothetical protein HPB47_024352 [Ixodes persulcatus]
MELVDLPWTKEKIQHPFNNQHYTVAAAMNRCGIFSDPLVLSVLSWREIEDAYLLLEEPPSRRFQSERGLLHVDRLDDEMFRSMFRFRKEHIGELQRALLMPETITSAQSVKMDGEEALYVTLRRLAYPNRWVDLEGVFGRHASVLSSVTSRVMLHINNTFGHLLDDLNIHRWLDVAKLEHMSWCRVIDKLLLNLEHDRATKIDIYTAIALVTASWKATRKSVIVNCFRHAGFKTSDAEDPSNLELPNQEATPSSWEALRQPGHVSEDSSFGDYLRDDADADIQATEVLDDSKILRLVATGQKDDAEAVEDPVPMPSQVMDAVDLLRRFAGAHEGTAVAFNALTTYEKCVLPLLKKRSQSKITSFFLEQ